MSGSKVRKREETKDAVMRTRVAKPAKRTITPPDDDGDAINELLRTSPDPSNGSRLRRAWRRLRWMLVVIPLIGLAAPIQLWVQYRSQHVTSKNSAVRGHVAEIGTRIGGLVASVAVDLGDRVKAGQVLVQLEDRHMMAEVQAARAEVASLERTIDVERMTVELERRQIAQLGPEAAARIAAANAKAEAVRVEAEAARRNHELHQTLHSQDGLVSMENLRSAQAQRLSAEARLEEAQANAAVAQQSVEQGARLAEDAVTIRQRRIAVLEADLEGARARLTRAEADFESAAIRAPDDGAIVRRIVQPGGAVEGGEPVISMWLGDDLWVEAWIDEEDLAFVQRGNRATVTFHSFPGREFSGRVDRIGLSTDLEIPDAEVPQPRSSRMSGAPAVSVRIRLDQPPPELLPGLSAVVAIEKTR